MRSSDLVLDRMGRTLVHQYVNQNDYTNLKQLLERLEDPEVAVDMADHFGERPMHLAVRAITPEGAAGNYLPVIQLLCDFGAKLEETNQEGETPLLIAAGMYRREDAIELLLNRGANPHATNNRGLNSLHLAIEKGMLGSAQLVAQRAPDLVNVCTNQQETPLMLAARNGSLQFITWFLQEHAAVDARDNHGNTALHHAAI